MKILIAGLGSIGRRHLKNLIAAGEEDILLYRTHQSSLPEAELAHFPVETDLQAALAQRPQAVIIANPTALHLDVAIPAAEAGCHILVEKPISHNLERIDQLQAALQRGGGQLLVGYHFRFHPGLQKVKELLSRQAIGRPLSLRAHWGEYLPNWHPWEDYRKGYSARSDLGGGVTLTLSHTLDYARWLLGEVHSLWAFAGRLGDLELSVEDTVEIGLKFENGVLGSVHMDYNQQPPAHTLEIIGTGGQLKWDNADGQVQVLRQNVQKPGEPVSEQYLVPEGFERADKVVVCTDKVVVRPDKVVVRNDLFLAEMRHFLAIARCEQAPACTLEDGYQALRLVMAAQESAQKGLLVFMQDFK